MAVKYQIQSPMNQSKVKKVFASKLSDPCGMIRPPNNTCGNQIRTVHCYNESNPWFPLVAQISIMLLYGSKTQYQREGENQATSFLKHLF